MVLNYWRHQENFAYRAGVTCTAIDPDGVRYIDPDGNEQKYVCDNVLLAIGMRALTAEAMELTGAAPYTVVIGDCNKPGSVQSGMRDAFGAASMI
jgi:hypothetical protein